MNFINIVLISVSLGLLVFYFIKSSKTEAFNYKECNEYEKLIYNLSNIDLINNLAQKNLLVCFSKKTYGNKDFNFKRIGFISVDEFSNAIRDESLEDFTITKETLVPSEFLLFLEMIESEKYFFKTFDAIYKNKKLRPIQDILEIKNLNFMRKKEKPFMEIFNELY